MSGSLGCGCPVKDIGLLTAPGAYTCTRRARTGFT